MTIEEQMISDLRSEEECLGDPICTSQIANHVIVNRQSIASIPSIPFIPSPPPFAVLSSWFCILRLSLAGGRLKGVG